MSDILQSSEKGFKECPVLEMNSLKDQFAESQFPGKQFLDHFAKWPPPQPPKIHMSWFLKWPPPQPSKIHMSWYLKWPPPQPFEIHVSWYLMEYPSFPLFCMFSTKISCHTLVFRERFFSSLILISFRWFEWKLNFKLHFQWILFIVLLDLE